MSRRFYAAVVKYALLFGSETWVVTSHIYRAMKSLHNQAACHISGWMPHKMRKLGWGYPLIGEVLADTCLKKIGVYINCCHNNVDQYIATRIIFDTTVAE